MTDGPGSRSAEAARTLRERAELRAIDAAGVPALTAEETARTLHELQVYQIELELQNEALRATQVELAASRERYRLLYDEAPSGYFTLDRNARIVQANGTLAALLGVDRGKLVGQPWTCFVTREHQDTWYLALRAAHNRRTLRSCELGLVGPAGEPLWVRIDLKPGDSAGAIWAAVTDLSARRAAEQALQENRDELAAILEGSPLPLLLVNPSRVVLKANSVAASALGRGHLVGKPFGDALSCSGPGGSCDADARRACAMCRMVLDALHEGKVHRQVEVELQRWEDGTMHERTFLVSTTPVLTGGERLALVGFVDVTEQKALERTVKTAQKMEAVGRLAGHMAHDFNNMLAVILGGAELLAGTLSGPAAEDVADIRTAAQRARGLTRQLLAMSRQQAPAPAPLDLNVAMLRMERVLRALLGVQIELALELSPDLPVVLADEIQLDQVLVNLLTNARDAMPGGGLVTVRTTVGRTDGHDFVQLTIADTGGGLTQAAREHLYEPYFTTKPHGQGTGLGLATVHGIVQQCGGRIEVDSRSGAGTRFDLFFPRASQAPPAITRECAVRPLRVGGESVLVVDDEPAVARAAARILEAHGYRVRVAGSGAEALAVLKEHPDTNVVLTDVVMPGMDGRELALQIASLGSAVKVVFMSGYAAPSDDPDAAPLGTAFVAKPFTADELCDGVNDALVAR